MNKKQLPSAAQAKQIAGLWAGRPHATATIGGEYTDPTILALWKRGWIEPTGEVGTSLRGAKYQICKLSALGIIALENYLYASRLAGTDR